LTSCCPIVAIHVPFNEHHVLLIVIKSTRPGCIHPPTNGAEIKQVGVDETDERPKTDRKDNRS
jgi:hypothetical protein